MDSRIRNTSKQINLIKPPIMNKKQNVTSDELDILKQKKFELIEELKLLKSKVLRLEAQTKRGGRSLTYQRSNFFLIDQLTQQYNSIQNYIEKQYNKLRKMKESDTASLIAELREEAIVVYNERLRLLDVKELLENDLNETQKEFDQLIVENGPETCKFQNKKIERFSEVLHKYKKANKKLAKKLAIVRSENAKNSDFKEAQIECRKNEIIEKINEAHEATQNYIDKMEKSKIEHLENVRKIREKLHLE